MGSDSDRRSNSNIWLALVAGLAVGFAVGREMGPRAAATPAETAEARPSPSAAPSAAPTVAAKYKNEAEFPAGWLKSSDLSAVAGVSWTGLSEVQKATALQALNERSCECGCGMGSIAACAKKDPNCPRSPKLVKG